jgi:hypothetical protein
MQTAQIRKRMPVSALLDPKIVGRPSARRS